MSLMDGTLDKINKDFLKKESGSNQEDDNLQLSCIQISLQNDEEKKDAGQSEEGI